MADVNKSKLQLGHGLYISGDKATSPATKLLINHGKPNFTIQRSPKAQNSNGKLLSPTSKQAPSSDEFVVKSTKFNGVFKPSNISAATKEIRKQNGSNMNTNDNEAAKVVLRRAKVIQPEMRENNDKNLPEFILRQRLIQERLANQNILDFENRRSGYFTQVMISPTNPNRQSFVETMASPTVKPGLEIPPSTQREEDIYEEVDQKEEQNLSEIEKNEEGVNTESVTICDQDEEEEVAKAIEEVNKAVEGEDDDKLEEEQTEKAAELTIMNFSFSEHDKEEVKPKEGEKLQEKTPEIQAEDETFIGAHVVVTSSLEVPEEKQDQNCNTKKDMSEEPDTNYDDVEEYLQNSHSHGKATDNGITISHTNGSNGPSLPSSDPKKEKDINFEPKTAVSFSQELGNVTNKYPNITKVVNEHQTPEINSELEELTKLKFEIKTDENDIEVKHILI